MQLLVVTACAPLSSQREQNYKRSPFSGNSYNLRLVDYTGGIGSAYGAVSGAFGVRPALLSEKLCVRRTQVIPIICVLSICTDMLVMLALLRSVAASACAPLSSQREQNYKAFAVLRLFSTFAQYLNCRRCWQ